MAEYDKLIVAIGRVPEHRRPGRAKRSGSSSTRAATSRWTSSNRTNLPNVYAIGDVVRGPMLAHKSSEEGVAVAETIAGQGEPRQSRHHPLGDLHLAGDRLGRQDRAAAQGGQACRIAPGSFRSSPAAARARWARPPASSKMLADAETDRILGVHIIGPYASELIAEAVVAMEFGASSEDIARIVHAHPTLSEAMHEAALGVHKRTLNI